jgi:putative DNA primase/helicase
MIALISAPDGSSAQLHRTFLGPNGKADLQDPRATMPGSIPDGAAIRLAPHGDTLGIAEGIETALGASALFDVPVWAAINSTMLTKWRAPEGVQRVIVFGDNDAKFGGAAAAFALAHRLVCRDGLTVDVRIPEAVDTDWADVHTAKTAGALKPVERNG